MKDGDSADIDLSAVATKAEVIENEEVTAAALNDLDKRIVALNRNVTGETATKVELSESIAAYDVSIKAVIVENEEVTAAALNDLNDKKASKEYVANAIAEAITNVLNTAV